MHPYVLAPLLACIGSCALASAVVARDPGSPAASRAAATLLGCIGLWALLDVLSSTASDAETALVLMRGLGIACLFLGPLSLQLLLALRPDLGPPFTWLLRFSYATSAVLGVGHLTGPWFVEAALPAASGWTQQFGPGIIATYFQSVSYPTLVVVVLARTGLGPHLALPPAFSRLAGVAIGLLILIATLTDLLLPALGIDAPPLGSACVALMVGGTWLVSSRLGHTELAPTAFAREILDALPDGIAILRGDGRIRVSNLSLARLMGVSREELESRPIPSLLADPPEDYNAEIRDRETLLRLAWGPALPVSVSTSILRDRQGFALGLVLAVRDHREMVELRRHLVTSARLAAVGELSAGIAHEVNNPIAFIQANLNLLLRHCDEVRSKSRSFGAALVEAPALIDDSLRGVERVASIVREVRGFSHGGMGRRQPAELSELLDGALRLAAHRIRHCAVVERHYATDLPRVECAGQDLKQVFLSLILNAARAVGDTGTIRLITECRDNQVVVRIEDDGCGIAPDQLERIFDPIVTPLAVGEGRGLGLSISYQILREHGGEISLESEPGAGTRVQVSLPLNGGSS
jgi:PAS domain S-box-containing protein